MPSRARAIFRGVPKAGISECGRISSSGATSNQVYSIPHGVAVPLRQHHGRRCCVNHSIDLSAWLERLSQPEDIASVVSFLAGLEGGWVNAQVLRANGGFASGLSVESATDQASGVVIPRLRPGWARRRLVGFPQSWHHTQRSSRALLWRYHFGRSPRERRRWPCSPEGRHVGHLRLQLDLFIGGRVDMTGDQAQA
jgi:hypothetical protein